MGYKIFMPFSCLCQGPKTIRMGQPNPPDEYGLSPFSLCPVNLFRQSLLPFPRALRQILRFSRRNLQPNLPLRRNLPVHRPRNHPCHHLKKFHRPGEMKGSLFQRDERGWSCHHPDLRVLLPRLAARVSLCCPRSLRALSFPCAAGNPLYRHGPKGSRFQGYEKMG